MTNHDRPAPAAPPTDPHDLARFLDAQSQGVYERALAEIHAGRKQSHWMWFIFPQLAGLGSSTTARHYAIRNRDEAAAYLAHPILGPRLTTIAEAITRHAGRSATSILGTPDDLKLHSCATLFASLSPPPSVFHRLLDHFYDGQPDRRTLVLLRHPIAGELGSTTERE